MCFWCLYCMLHGGGVSWWVRGLSYWLLVCFWKLSSCSFSSVHQFDKRMKNCHRKYVKSLMCERMHANITTFFVLGLWNAFVCKSCFFFVDAWSLCFLTCYFDLVLMFKSFQCSAFYCWKKIQYIKRLNALNLTCN